MEKWAKNLNVLKEAQKDQTKKSLPGSQAGSAGVSRQESATADAGFAILQKTVSHLVASPSTYFFHAANYSQSNITF